jgi:ACS family glucarate transporter-like MFS transporter
MVAGAVWYAIARNGPEEHPGVSAGELATIRSGLAVRGNSSATAAETADALLPWGTILASKDVWAITLGYFCYGYVAWIFFSWFYIYLAKVRGLDLKSSAFYAMLPFLAMAACCPLGGLISDRLTKWRGKRLGRCGLAVFAMALCAAFLAFGSSVDSARVASVVLAGGAGALYLSQSSFWSTTADIGGVSSGSVSGLMNMGAQMGGAITASLTPVIASRYGWAASFAVAAALCGLGALAWLLVDPERQLAPAAAPVAQTRIAS